MKIASLIKYEGDNSIFVWKHPNEDFNFGSQLIVHESQEALFLMNGQALDVFGPGRHVLKTQNIPLLKGLFNQVNGDESQFHCEVYFINMADVLALFWGTPSKITYLDPKFRFPISIGASGVMNIRVTNSRKLVVKLVGTETLLTVEGITNYFRSTLLSKVKSVISKTIIQMNLCVFELDENIDHLSKKVKDEILSIFEDYGVQLVEFFINTIMLPKDDEEFNRFRTIFYKQYTDLAEANLNKSVGIITEETEAEKRVIKAKSIKNKRDIEGYTYQEKRGFDISEEIAKNEGVGNFTSTGIGLGVMTSVSNKTGSMVTKSLEQTETKGEQEVVFCSKCGTKNRKEAVFCGNCGNRLSVEKYVCPKCGSEMSEEMLFCTQCGFRRLEK